MQRHRPSYLNAVLTVIAALLCLNLLVAAGDGAGNAAMAEPPDDIAEAESKVPFNAAEQRKTMIAQLEQMNRRLTAIETKLDRGISVKVTEMPPLTLPDAN